jgi:hypothetical protein
MEQNVLDHVSKNLKTITKSCIVFIVLVSIIIVMITIISRLTEYDLSFFLAVSVASSCGIGAPIVILILSSIGKANLNKNPKLLYGLNIGILVMSMATMALIYGGVENSRAMIEDFEYAFILANPYRIITFVLHGIIMVFIIILVFMAIRMIVAAVGNLKLAQPFIERKTIQPVSSGSATVAALPSSGSVFCPQCGVQNASDAKFCKSCGKTI